MKLLQLLRAEGCALLRVNMYTVLIRVAEPSSEITPFWHAHTSHKAILLIHRWSKFTFLIIKKKHLICTKVTSIAVAA
jgi:hypothetical protein